MAQLKITSEAINYLEQYHWPGNVRELEHVVSRSALKARSRQKKLAIVSIEKQDCGALTSLQSNVLDKTKIIKNTGQNSSSIKINLKDETEQFQRQLIKQVLRQENGNWAAAARRMSVDRANLNRIAKRLDIKVIKSIL